MKRIVFALAISALVLTANGQTVPGQPAQVQYFERRIRIEGPGPEQVSVDGPMAGMVNYMAAEFGPIGPVVKKAPYSAEAVNETVQQLADGNRIVRKSVSQLARDSEGRTRRLDRIEAIGPWAGGKPHETILIDDPNTHTNWILDPARKVANKIVLPAMDGHVKAAVAGEVMVSAPGNNVMFTRRLAPADAEARRKNYQQEALGKRVIEGVEAEGTKTTISVPAGEVGNELPIQTVSERWFSPELQVVVLSKRSDPRFGETTYKLTNIQRSEPSRTLFEVPADYTIKEGKLRTETVTHEP